MRVLLGLCMICLSMIGYMPGPSYAASAAEEFHVSVPLADQQCDMPHDCLSVHDRCSECSCGVLVNQKLQKKYNDAWVAACSNTSHAVCDVYCPQMADCRNHLCIYTVRQKAEERLPTDVVVLRRRLLSGNGVHPGAAMKEDIGRLFAFDSGHEGIGKYMTNGDYSKLYTFSKARLTMLFYHAKAGDKQTYTFAPLELQKPPVTPQ